MLARGSRRIARRTARAGRPRRGSGRRRGRVRAARQGARRRLRYFRQATLVTVAVTGLLLMLLAPSEAGTAQDPAGAAADTAAELPDTVSIIQSVPVEDLTKTAAAAEEDEPLPPVDTLAREGTRAAARTLRGLWVDFYHLLPQLVVAFLILLGAGVLVRFARPVLHRGLRSWQRADAVTALFGIAVWLLAVGIAFSVLTGDIRALVGSLGLVGLALSWALQSPIESFTGWLLNSFQSYYRVGDRIAVGEIHGDVYRIDLLTTTVWEYGGPDRQGIHVQGEQATGRLITFPNSEVLTGSIVNYTRDLPYVWDEVRLKFSGASDIDYLEDLVRRVADEVVGEYMRVPAQSYAATLRRKGLEPWIAEEPEVYVEIAQDGWLEVILRYLVAARERRPWRSRLVRRLLQELQTPESKRRVTAAIPKQLVQLLDEEGRPAWPWPDGEG